MCIVARKADEGHRRQSRHRLAHGVYNHRVFLFVPFRFLACLLACLLAPWSETAHSGNSSCSYDQDPYSFVQSLEK